MAVHSPLGFGVVLVYPIDRVWTALEIDDRELRQGFPEHHYLR